MPQWVRTLAWFWRTRLGRSSLVLLSLIGALMLALLPTLVLEHEFDRLELEATRRDAARIVEGVQNELRVLGELGEDWGAWDDTYAYVVDKNSAYQKANLDWDSLLNTTHVELIYLLDRNNTIIWGGFHPRDASQPLALPAFTQERLRELPILPPSQEEPRSGILLTSSGPLLLISQPIRPSSNKGASRGTLLMGRLLDRGRLDKLSRLLAIPFEARDTLRDPLDPAEASAWARRGWAPQHRIQSESRMDILVAVPDLSGQERIVFTLPWERTIHVQGLRARWLVFTGLFLTVLTVAGMLLLAFLQHLRLTRRLHEDLEASVARKTAELLEARSHQEQLEQHRLIIGLSSSAVLIGHPGERILECNASASHCFLYSMEEFIQLTLLDLFPSKHIEMIQRILSEDFDTGEGGLEIEGKRKNGSTFPAEIIAKFFTAGGDRRFVVFIRDLTNRKRAEEALSFARRQESLASLAGGIAHDFNNLFCGILGNLDLSQESIAAGSPVSLHLERIRREVLRASELSRKMLMFSGKGRFAMGQLDLNQLLEEELKSLLALDLATGATLNFRFGRDLPRVEGDPAQLLQVVQYLLTNASESFGESEGVIDVTTGIQDLDSAAIQQSFPGQQLAPGPYVTLEVADNGCGIQSEDLPRIFDPFYSTKFTGRGLSLAVAQSMLRAHKAGFAITSTVGVGTTFKLFFPSVPSTHRTPVETSPATPPVRGSILFVDDEPILRETVTEMLELGGYAVITAKDGLEAVDRYRENSQEIALVILDLTMPRMDGKAALQAIRTLNPEAKVVISSGYNEKDTIQQFQGVDLAGFLPKPYRMTQLAGLVGRFVSHG